MQELKDITQIYYTKLRKPTEKPIGLIPTGDGKFPQRIIQAMCNEMIWF
jgi:hypothetical protein